MCIGSKPKTVVVEKPAEPVKQEVEKIPDPAPTPISPTDVGSNEARVEAEKERNRKKKGFASTRVADNAVLTDTAQSGNRQTLG